MKDFYSWADERLIPLEESPYTHDAGTEQNGIQVKGRFGRESGAQRNINRRSAPYMDDVADKGEMAMVAAIVQHTVPLLNQVVIQGGDPMRTFRKVSALANREIIKAIRKQMTQASAQQTQQPQV